MKLGEIDGVKFLARKSGGVNFWTNSVSGCLTLSTCICLLTIQLSDGTNNVLSCASSDF